MVKYAKYRQNTYFITQASNLRVRHIIQKHFSYWAQFNQKTDHPRSMIGRKWLTSGQNSTFYKNTLFESIFTPESYVYKILPTENKYVVKNDHKVCQTS